MTRSRRRIDLMAACLLAAACSGGEVAVQYTLVDPAHRLPARPVYARVQFFAAKGLECPYDTVGTVRVERREPLPSRETTLALNRQVRRMGGDGIIGPAPSGPGLTGTVIRFRDTTCTK